MQCIAVSSTVRSLATGAFPPIGVLLVSDHHSTEPCWWVILMKSERFVIAIDASMRAGWFYCLESRFVSDVWRRKTSSYTLKQVVIRIHIPIA
jgi:hypothetical protein